MIIMKVIIACIISLMLVIKVSADCPPVTTASAHRGQIHTQVFNVTTGHLMSFMYERTYVDSDNADVYAILGVVDQCPPQGCQVDPKQTEDCTQTQAAQQTFGWAAVHRNLIAPTTSINLSIKEPSGTLFLSQNVNRQKGKVLTAVCPQPEPDLPLVTSVLKTEIENNQHEVWGIVSVRIYSKRHAGTSNFDFYTLIGVNPNIIFPSEPPSQCVTTTTNKAGWYDLYWALSQNTVSEATTTDAQDGSIILLQGY